MAAAVLSMMLRVVASVPHNDQPSTAKAFASRFPSRRPVAMQPEKVLSESHLKIAYQRMRRSANSRGKASSLRLFGWLNQMIIYRRQLEGFPNLTKMFQKFLDGHFQMTLASGHNGN